MPKRASEESAYGSRPAGGTRLTWPNCTMRVNWGLSFEHAFRCIVLEDCRSRSQADNPGRERGPLGPSLTQSAGSGLATQFRSRAPHRHAAPKQGRCRCGKFGNLATSFPAPFFNGPEKRRNEPTGTLLKTSSAVMAHAPFQICPEGCRPIDPHIRFRRRHRPGVGKGGTARQQEIAELTLGRHRRRSCRGAPDLFR